MALLADDGSGGRRSVSAAAMRWLPLSASISRKTRNVAACDVEVGADAAAQRADDVPSSLLVATRRWMPAPRWHLTRRGEMARCGSCPGLMEPLCGVTSLTRNSLPTLGSVDEQSASFARQVEPVADGRLRLTAWDAARLVFARAGRQDDAGDYRPRCSVAVELLSPARAQTPSTCASPGVVLHCDFVWPWNCGSTTYTDRIAVMPGGMSSCGWRDTALWAPVAPDELHRSTMAPRGPPRVPPMGGDAVDVAADLLVRPVQPAQRGGLQPDAAVARAENAALGRHQWLEPGDDLGEVIADARHACTMVMAGWSSCPSR